MSPVDRSIQVWGYYAFAVGLLLAVAPNRFLAVLQIPPTSEPWIRVLGAVAIAIGFYYLGAVRGGVSREFATATVFGRTVVTMSFVAVVAGWGYWLLLLPAVVEASSAVWTWSAMQRTGQVPDPEAPAV